MDISSLFLFFTTFLVSLVIILAVIVRPKSIRIPIKSRHVFITGASSGIGLALAHLAAAKGARVSILARSAEKLADAKRSIQLSTGIEGRVLRRRSRPIDVLIVNQGVFIGKELEKQSSEEVKFMIDVNLLGSFNVIKAALPAMKGRGPAFISLVSSQAGQDGYTAYSASKFGLQGLAQALQQEVISDDIHVSILFPPDTDTPGFEEEQKKRPELTSIIAASSGSMKTKEVAKICLDGIKAGKFSVTCHPQRSFWLAFIEVMSGGLIRLVGLFFQWDWYKTIAKWMKTKREANRKLA